MSKQTFNSYLNPVRIKEIENKLIKSGADFEVIQSNYSIVYKLENKNLVFGSTWLGIGAMKIFQQVKSDIKRNLDGGMFLIENTTPVYYDLNLNNLDKQNDSLYNCTEVDINKAYLTSAHLQGIISDKIFDRLMTVSREIRLRALGSIASRKTVTEYKRGKIENVYLKQNENGKLVWNMICAGVSEIMSELIRVNFKEEFIFFWVDNLFLLHKRSFESTLIKIVYPVNIDYSRERYMLKLLVDKKRPFNLPLQTKKELI